MADPRQLFFIDPTADPAQSNEAVRVHVMREFHRARRQLQGMLQWSGPHSQIAMLSGEAVPNPAQQDPNQATTESTSTENPSSLREGSSQSNIEADKSEASELQRIVQERLSHIFRTATNTAATALKTYRILKDLPDEIVDLCEEDPAALYALLALVVSAQQEIELFQAAEYESLALQSLRLRLASYDSPTHSDGTIMTILLLFKLELSRSNDEVASFHEGALLRMIHDRGGVEKVYNANRQLGVLLRAFYSGQTG